MTRISAQPSYLRLPRWELEERIERAWAIMSGPCRVCPRHCRVNRAINDRRGYCKVGTWPVVAAYHPHFGEESPLVGNRGSGTIFFASCNIACLYCQNWEISQLRQGQEVPPRDLAAMMLRLQSLGCHNINLVSPTIYIPQILKALPHAIDGGLRVPLVYNTGGYDEVEALRLLDGVVDIYMPDIKYSNDEIAAKYSIVRNYYRETKAAVKEMHRQVGDLVIEDGLAVRGLIIRHLVLPNGLSGTAEVMRFIAQELSPHSYVNIMAQYRPEHRAQGHPQIARRITAQEHQEALHLAQEHGLYRFA